MQYKCRVISFRSSTTTRVIRRRGSCFGNRTSRVLHPRTTSAILQLRVSFLLILWKYDTCEVNERETRGETRLWYVASSTMAARTKETNASLVIPARLAVLFWFQYRQEGSFQCTGFVPRYLVMLPSSAMLARRVERFAFYSAAPRLRLVSLPRIYVISA